MERSRGKDNGKLIFQLQQAAIPERVAEVAHMFHKAIHAATDVLPPDSITMVVNNYNMSAEMRGNNIIGKQTVDHIYEVIDDPVKAIQKRPRLASVARILAKDTVKFIEHGAIVKRPQARKKKTIIDKVFIEAMKGAAESLAATFPKNKGTIILFSRVYRVGRTSENSKAMARVLIDGQPTDIAVGSEMLLSLFDAAKSDKIVRIKLLAFWDQNSFSIDTTKSRIVEVDQNTDLSSGADILEMLQKNDGLLSNASLRKMLEDIGNN